MLPKRTATLTCRLVSLYFLFQAGANLLAVPSAAYNAFVVAYLGSWNSHPRVDYYRFTSLVSYVVYFCAELAVAIFFYRCGPKAVRFLFGKDEDGDVETSTPATEPAV